MNGMIRWMGDTLPILKLARHYRAMTKANPTSAAFWRTRCRAAIYEYRRQVEDALGTRLAA